MYTKDPGICVGVIVFCVVVIDFDFVVIKDDFSYKNVTVYCSGDMPRNNAGGWSVVALKSDKRGYEFYRQKDIAMTVDCDCGYMIWDGISKGTMQNIEDLKRAGKPVKIEFADTQ